MMGEPLLCNVVLRDLSSPNGCGRTVTLLASHAQRLVAEGLAMFEQARTMGRVWHEKDASEPVGGPAREG